MSIHHHNNNNTENSPDCNEQRQTITHRLLKLLQKQHGSPPPLVQSTLLSIPAYFLARGIARLFLLWQQRLVVYIHQKYSEQLILTCEIEEQRQSKLAQLEQDDPTLTTLQCYPFGSSLRFSDFCNSLNQALMQSTHLRNLSLIQFDFESLSLLTTGIAQSNLEALTLKRSIPRPPLGSKYQQEIQNFALLVSEILVESTSLKMLTLENIELRNRSMTLLAQGLRHNSTITNLTLQGCDVGGDDGLRVLFSKGITDNKNNSRITNIKLEYCKIRDTGVEILIQHWQPNWPIQRLALPRNRIGAEGALMLFRTAHHRPALEMLDLSFNRNMGYEALQMIGSDLSNQPYLTSVVLFGCASYDCTPHQASNRSLAEQSLLHGVKNNLQLKDVNLFGNDFTIMNQLDCYFIRNRMPRQLEIF